MLRQRRCSVRAFFVGHCEQPAISPGSKPVKLRSKSAELRSSSPRLSRSSSRSAQETLLLTIERKAFSWVGVYSSQSSTGTSAMESLRAAFRGEHLQPCYRCGKHGILKPTSRMLPHINSLPKNRSRRHTTTSSKIDLVWRNLSEGALYAGLSNRVCGCHSTPGSSSLHVVSSPRGSALQCFATWSSFTQRSGALAYDFGQQNDKRQADQPEQNPNRDPTHGFGSLSVMGRFTRMRRLCHLHHCSVLSKKEACTRNHYFQFTPAIQRPKAPMFNRYVGASQGILAMRSDTRRAPVPGRPAQFWRRSRFQDLPNTYACLEITKSLRSASPVAVLSVQSTSTSQPFLVV